MRSQEVLLAVATMALLLGSPTRGQAPSGQGAFTIVDKETGKPIPARIHLKDQAGKPVKAGKLPFWFDHFVCPGSARLDLPAGEYRYEVEHGPEFTAATGNFAVKANTPVEVKVELRRLADLAKEGWWSGETHVHRPVEDIELLMRAEDLHIAPVITWWKGAKNWRVPRELPKEPLVRFDGNRWYHSLAGEDERNGGALLYFNLSRPLDLSAGGKEHPSPMKYLLEARQHQGVWIDIEKPFWWDVPVWLASGKVDSIGLANNHMDRDRVMDQEAWGKPRDRARLLPPLGNGLWTQEIYYHALNSGLRLPPSAGSASGVLPNPVGYNRVYVYLGQGPTYEKWWEGLRAGRAFVTNGPLLRVRANDQLPGHVFTSADGKAVELLLDAQLTSRDKVASFQIVQNGKVERTVPIAEWKKTGTLGKLRFEKSGWFLVRTIADHPKTFRFASTAPFYVEVGKQTHRISKASAQFFLDWTGERMKLLQVADAEQRREVVQYHDQARKFWEDRVRMANAE